MLTSLLDRICAAPIWMHGVAAAASFTWFNWIGGVLDASYAASGHPVDYATGQTAFSGPVIKGYYGAMIDGGTLDMYTRTQLIDFGFIAGMVLIALFICTLVARIGRAGSWGRRLGFLAAGSGIIGAAFDVLENGWSFMMIANPVDFADWLALPYSMFAVLKFAFITLGMALLLASLVSSFLGRLLGRPMLG